MPVTRDKKAPSWPTMTRRNHTIAQCGSHRPTTAKLEPVEKTEQERPNWAGRIGRPAMTLGMIEGVLLMGMVGLTWMMLDISTGDHHAGDKRQADASPDHHYRMHQPLRLSPALQKPEVMVFLPAALIEHPRNAAYGREILPSRPGGPSDRRYHDPDGGDQRRGLSQACIPLKREAMTKRALSGPLR